MYNSMDEQLKSTAVISSKDKFTYRKSGIVFLYIVTPLPIVVTAVAISYKYYGVRNNETDTLI